jgi:hypothetical protein
MPQELVWPSVINRDTPAWQTLQRLLAESPPSADQNRLVVFGSAALQLTVASNLLSADIDLSLDVVTIGPRGLTAPKAQERLRRAVAKVNAALSKDLPYIQVCHWMTFQPGNRWERRSVETSEGNWRVVYPYPYDILFSKLRRAEAKDIEAFYGKRSGPGQLTSIVRLRNPRSNSCRPAGPTMILHSRTNWPVVDNHRETRHCLTQKEKTEAGPRLKVRRDSRETILSSAYPEKLGRWSVGL